MGYHKPKGPTGGGPATATAANTGPRKRKAKEYNAGEIAPTAETMRIDPLNAAHPITLPFMDPHMAARRAFEAKLHPHEKKGADEDEDLDKESKMDVESTAHHSHQCTH